MNRSGPAEIKHKFFKATKEFVVIALYLWLVFGLFAIYRSVILAKDHVSIPEESFALINALVLGKVVLSARKLHLGNFVDDAPLIYPTLVKSALFAAILAVFKILEEAAGALYRGKSFHEGIADLGGGTWQGIVCLAVILFLLLIPFFGFAELQRVLGEGKLQELFFRQRRSSM
jgi:hypothetical protein